MQVMLPQVGKLLKLSYPGYYVGTLGLLDKM